MIGWYSYYMQQRIIIMALFVILGGGLLFWSRQTVPQKVEVQKAQEDEGTILSGSFDKSKMKTDEEWKKLLNSITSCGNRGLRFLLLVLSSMKSGRGHIIV